MIDAILDTNIVIDVLANHAPATNWFIKSQTLQLGITPITWLEAVRGARNKNELKQIVEFLKQFDVEYPTNTDNNWAMS